MQRETLCCSQELLVLKLKNVIAEALLKSELRIISIG